MYISQINLILITFFPCFNHIHTECDGDSKDWSCCSSTSKCGVGEGDCDNDSHCNTGLKCGTNNCKQFNPLAQKAADCCIEKTPSTTTTRTTTSASTAASTTSTNSSGHN